MKGARLSVLVSLAAVFLLIAATLPQSTSAFPYRLEGYLKDDAGNPISGATIEVTGQIFVYNGTVQTLSNVRRATTLREHSVRIPERQRSTLSAPQIDAIPEAIGR